MTKFDREKCLVERMLGPKRDNVSLQDPRNDADETGVDVILVAGGSRIGVQVTEYDAGKGVDGYSPGQLRGEEKRRVKSTRESSPKSYGGIVPAQYERSLRDIIKDKGKKSWNNKLFDEAWLLVSANIPEWGAMNSTFIGMDGWKFNVDGLNASTHAMLETLEFDRVFLSLVAGETLYEWRPDTGWLLSRAMEFPNADDPKVAGWRALLRGRLRSQSIK